MSPIEQLMRNIAYEVGASAAPTDKWPKEFDWELLNKQAETLIDSGGTLYDDFVHGTFEESRLASSSLGIEELCRAIDLLYESPFYDRAVFIF